MGSLKFNLRTSPGSQWLSYVKGLNQLNPDLARPTVFPFRSTLLTATNATETDTVHVQSDFDFYAECMTGYIEPLAADTREIAQYVKVNFRESSRNSDAFVEDMPLTALCYARGGTGGAAVALPDFSYGPLALYKFTVPYLFQAGMDVQAKFLAEAGLGATARNIDLFLVGTLVRKDTEVETEDSAAEKALVKIAEVVSKLPGALQAFYKMLAAR